MDHANEGRQFAVDPLEHRVNRGWVGQVREFDTHLDPAVPECGNRFPGFRVRVSSTVQHDGPRPVIRKPAGYRASDAAQPPGNEVGTVLPQPVRTERRRRQDDLPDMSRAAHERHGGPRFRHGPHGVDQRLQLSRLEPAHHPPQGGSRPRGFLYLQDVQFQDGVGHVRTHLGHFFGAQDVPSGQLHEAAPLGQTGEARFDEPLSGQAVHHDVHARASGDFENLFSEGCLAAVEDVFHAQGPQVRAFRRARGRKDLRPGGLGQLDGRQAHAARPGVNQYPVAGFQPGKLEGKGRRNEHLGHRRQGSGRQLRWCGRNQFLPGDGFRTHGAESQADHAVTGRDRGYPGTHLPDPAAELRAEKSSLHQADGAEDVQEVQPADVDRNPDFAGFEGRRRPGLGMQFLEGTILILRELPVRIFRQRHAFHAVRGPDQAGDQTAVPTAGNVRFAVGEEQFFGQVGGRLRGGVGIEIDHPGLHVARFPGQYPAEAPERGAGELAASLALQDLAAPRDEPGPTGRRRIGVRRALDEGERTRQSVSQVLRHLRGGCPRTVAVERPEVHDACQRWIARQVREEGTPGFARGAFHGSSGDSGPAVGRYSVRSFPECSVPVRSVPVRGEVLARQHDSLVSRREFHRHRLAHTAPVGRHHPHAAREDNLRRTAGHDHSAIGQAGLFRSVHAHDFRFRESDVQKRLPPYVRTCQGVIRPVAVGEPPPTVELSEYQIHPTPATLVLERYELPGRSEQPPAMIECFVQVLRCVEYVGRDDHVVAMQVETLRNRVLLDIQHAVFDGALVVAETGLRLCEETRRNIRIGVVVTAGAKLGEDTGGRRADARPDLDHLEPPPFRQRSDDHLDHVPHHQVRGFPHRRLHIEIAGARFFIAEQQGQRILPAAEHLRQGAGATTEQGDLAGAVGMQSGQPGRAFRGVCRHAFRERITGSHRHDETVILLFQHARIRQQVQNPVEELPVLVENAQLSTQAYSFYG